MTVMKDEELKELYTYNDLATLKIIELILKNNNIRYMLRSFEDAAYNGLFTTFMGKGKIFVFEKDYKQAIQLLKDKKILC